MLDSWSTGEVVYSRAVYKGKVLLAKLLGREAKGQDGGHHGRRGAGEAPVPLGDNGDALVVEVLGEVLLGPVKG